MDSLDVNDTCKRPISNKNIYIWFVNLIFFTTPKLYFATHSLRSPDLIDCILELVTVETCECCSQTNPPICVKLIYTAIFVKPQQ